jgi:hypothetical protein
MLDTSYPCPQLHWMHVCTLHNLVRYEQSYSLCLSTGTSWLVCKFLLIFLNPSKVTHRCCPALQVLRVLAHSDPALAQLLQGPLMPDGEVEELERALTSLSSHLDSVADVSYTALVPAANATQLADMRCFVAWHTKKSSKLMEVHASCCAGRRW